MTTLPPAASLPALPPSVPSKRYPIAAPLGRLILWLLGWKWVGGFADVPRQVIIGWPHTSNWDGIVGLSAAAVCGLDARIFAKRQLFRPPIGWMLRAFGGTPIDRTKGGGVVERAVERFEQAEAAGEPFVLGIAPEGTRGRREAWKTGFHRIAVRANVPIAIVALDFGRKQIGVVGTLVPSGDLEADLGAIRQQLAGVRGKHPENETPPRAPEPTAGPATPAA
ncbi:MAG TPA: acyltransferase [Bacteroidetes bacterium]|nr:acyltransferase [Bacteroidota bacterium]HIL57531.1 acyltransferase [Rhodothermales bacterium]